MWVADMDFISPPSVIEALLERVRHGVFGYAVPPDELNQIVQQRLESEYGWKVKEEWFVWLPGLVTGINVTCRSVGLAGDSVLTNTPAYPPFLTAPAQMERDLITAPLVLSSDRWQIDFDALESAVTKKTRLFILCNPHNPTGRLFRRDELEKIVDFCERYDLILCSDEIHCDIILDEDGRHVPTATMAPEVARRTITLMAPSKTYNIPGLGCSLAVIPDDVLRDRFQTAMAGIVPHVNIMGFTAALAAYRDGTVWLERLLHYLKQNRDLVTSTINQIDGLSMAPVEATYLAWIDTRDTGIADPVAFFEKGGVGLSDGHDFGMDGFVRLNFGCPRALVQQGLDRMKRILGG